MIPSTLPPFTRAALPPVAVMPTSAAEYSTTVGLLGVVVAALFWGCYMLWVKTKAVLDVKPDTIVVQARTFS